MDRFKVLTFNKLAEEGLQRLPAERYEVGPDVTEPDAIMLRSYTMHGMPLPGSLRAVARAGAGVNNIPVETLSRQGIPVFNAPGANANAVKELVIGALLMVARNLPAAGDYVRGLHGDDAQIGAAVEAGKKQFVGFELPSRTMGVIGLGAIGVEVANAALALGMKVVGFDPKMTVRRAWQLSSGVEQATELDEVFQRSDVVSPHVPLNGQTRALLNRKRLELLSPGAIVLNFSRQGVVDDAAVLDLIQAGRIGAYVTDFPTEALMGEPRAVCLPHLGASTTEAEANCAVMVAEHLRAYLEHGEIRASVNFPRCIAASSPVASVVHCQRQCSKHGGTDLNRAGGGADQYRRLAQRVARRVGLYADRRGRTGGQDDHETHRVHRWHTLRETPGGRLARVQNDAPTTVGQTYERVAT